MADVLLARRRTAEKDCFPENQAARTADDVLSRAAGGAPPSPSTGRGAPARFVRAIHATPSPGVTMDWYILFDRGAQAGLYKAETEEAAIERACQLLRAGIIVREVGRFDERRRAMKAAKLIKICAERQRREASEPER
jgi:hypothetical protein